MNTEESILMSGVRREKGVMKAENASLPPGLGADSILL